MIYSNLHVQDGFSSYPRAIQKALEYLRTTDFSVMEPGDYPLEGDKLYAKVFDITSQPLENCKAEFHKEYLDVQYWVSGEELIGVAPALGQIPVLESHPDRDLYFCQVSKDESLLHAKQGDFMVFFPFDIHRPGAAWNGKCLAYRKVVVKLHTSLLKED